MVHVFQTSVRSEEQVQHIGLLLNIILSAGDWNFDLEDRDNILRIDTAEIPSQTFKAILNSQGFDCNELN